MPEILKHRRMLDAFDKARRAVDAKDFLTAQRWEQTRQIELRAERLREISRQRFKEEYQKRLAREIKRLLNDRYSPTRNHKPKDVGDPNDITRQADKNIRKQQQRTARINRSEENMMKEVRQQAREMRGYGVRFEVAVRKQEDIEKTRLFRRKK